MKNKMSVHYIPPGVALISKICYNDLPMEEIEELKIKCEEYLNGWKRAKADFINQQKEESARLEAILKFGHEQLMKELIITMDSFGLALAAQPAEKGFCLVRQQLEDLLKRNGLEKVSVVIGQEFDPSFQEAVAVVESEGPSNTVVEEIERGYTLHGKLIRPARVKVSK